MSDSDHVADLPVVDAPVLGLPRAERPVADLPPEGLGPADAEVYRTMQAALSQTARGRWFLAEFARRNGPAKPASRADAALLGACRAAGAGVLEAAERIGEVAWILREQGVASEACDLLERRARELYACCAQQDIALRSLEALGGPEPGEDRSPQTDRSSAREFGPAPVGATDALPASGASGASERPGAGTPGPVQAEAASRARHLQQLAILAGIDELDLHAKLRLFT